MKTILLLLLLSCTFVFSQNIYLSTPTSSTVVEINTEGRGGILTHWYHAAGWYIYNYSARIHYPGGDWSDWQGGESGGWWVTKAGTYYIEGKGYGKFVPSGESSNLVRDPFSFTVVDYNSPAQPSGLSIGVNPGNYAVSLSWSANSEYDLSSYEVSRQINEYGSWSVIGSTSGTSFVDPDWKIYGTSAFDVSYRIRALDINGNYSSYSSTAVCNPYPMFKRGADLSSSVPSDYSISNYPNPFNPTTVISYQLPKDGFVTLKVHDILGKEVASLVSENKQAGYYNATFNASNLPSGIYIYSLQANGFNQSKKMLLVK